MGTEAAASFRLILCDSSDVLSRECHADIKVGWNHLLLSMLTY